MGEGGRRNFFYLNKLNKIKAGGVFIMSKIVEKVKFAGTEVELQNMTIIMPTLNFQSFREKGAMKKLNKVVKALGRMEQTQEFDLTDEELDTAVELVWMAAQRNYPEISKEQIAEGLDFDVLGKVMPVLISKNPLGKVREVSDAGKNE